MGYIREPKNVDLVVAPSVFTEETRSKITQAIAQYKKTGKKPESVQFITQGSVKMATHVGYSQVTARKPNQSHNRKAKI